MKKQIKRFLSLIICAALCLSLLSESLCSFAEDWNYKSPAMIEYDVTWYNPSTFKSIVRGNNALSFTVGFEGLSKTMKLSLSFPQEGGIRFYSTDQGYFTPSGVNRITYTTVSTNVYKLTPANSTLCVILDYNTFPWSIQYFDSSNGKSFTVDANQMFFGFDGSNVMRKVKLEGSLSSDEVVYGFGERYNSFNQVGKTVPLWNTDTGYHTWTENSPEKLYSYTNVPLMHSSAGYSLFFNSAFGGYADIGNTDSSKFSLEFNGTDFDFYTYLGTPLENIENYTALTGRPTASPEWAFSYWAGAKGSAWASGDGYEANVKAVLENYKAMGTMPSAVYLENTKNADGDTVVHEGALSVANSYGVHALSWNNPSLTPLKPYEETNGNSLSKANLSILLPDVSEENIPSSFHDCWGEYSNPLLVTALKNGGYTKLLNNGLSGAMLDYGEFIAPDLNLKNVMQGIEIHNFYAYFYNKALSEVFGSVRGDDYILFARAGCAGSQAYATSFGGDVNTSYDGLQASLLAGITISASGFSTWGSDIAGHHLSSDYGYELTDELYQRWLQFSLFSPLMRLHGTLDKDPWNFGTQAQETFKTAYALRENIIDLLYSANLTANTTGAPMMQVMAMSFPEEKKLASVDDQYLFCNELMVCPVVTKGAISRTVKLPEGRWTSLWDGSLLGGGTHTVSAPVNKIPVYIRDGAVIPVTLSENHSIFEQPSESGFSALIITPAADEREVSYETAEGEKAHFTNTRSENVCNITANDQNSRTKLVIAGTFVDSVKVDGVALTELSSITNSQKGFYVDTLNNRTIVNTGSAWTTLEFIEQETYLNGFTYTDTSDSISDFAVYFANGNSTTFVEEKASAHLTSADGTLARQTVAGGYSDRDIDRNIVSAVLLTRKYEDFVLDATIKGTAGGASSLGFVIGQQTPGAHYMSSANGGYAVFFKRFGTKMDLAIAYNGKTINSSGTAVSFNRNTFAGELANFPTNFGISTSDPMKIRLIMENKVLKAYIYNDLQGKYVQIGGSISLSSYKGGYIALAQSTAQTTAGAPADQYFDALQIRSDAATFIDRSPEATLTATSYTNTFTNSSLSMLQNDFDIYYAENQLNSNTYVKESMTNVANRLYINSGWLNRNYQGGNNWQPYLGNVILQYKHGVFGDVKTEFSNRFLNGGTAKSTFMTVQIGQQEKGRSVYDTDSAAGGYLVTLQLCGGAWSKITVVQKDVALYTAAIGTEEALATRPGFDKYVYVADYNNLVEGTFSVEVKDKKLTVKRCGTVVISDFVLENYEPGYVSVGFDIGNPDSGTAINSLAISGAQLPVYANVYGSTVTLRDFEGYEFSTDGVNFNNQTVFTGLSHNTVYTFYHRIAATENYAAGGILSKTITIKFLPGDYNGDNVHQSTDLSILRKVLLGTGTADEEISDVNTDTTVDIRDLVGLKKLTVKQ